MALSTYKKVSKSSIINGDQNVVLNIVVENLSLLREKFQLTPLALSCLSEYELPINIQEDIKTR